jgi:asparaginyl-tRNA synthetase
VYAFGPTFRAENSHTPRHLAEFWMIEPEVAFAQLTDVMALAERCIKSSTQHVLDHCAAGRLALLFFVFDFFPIS